MTTITMEGAIDGSKRLGCKTLQLLKTNKIGRRYNLKKQVEIRKDGLFRP